MNVSIVDVDDELAFSIILTIDTVSVLINAVELVLLRVVVLVVTVFGARIAVTTEFTLFIIAGFTGLTAKTACSAAFQIGSSSTFEFPLEVENGLFAILCEVFRVVIFLIRAVHSVTLEEAVLHANSSLPYLVIVFLIFAGGELGVARCVISASLDQLISFLHNSCAQLSSSF